MIIFYIEKFYLFCDKKYVQILCRNATKQIYFMPPLKTCFIAVLKDKAFKYFHLTFVLQECVLMFLYCALLPKNPVKQYLSFFPVPGSYFIVHIGHGLDFWILP